MPKGVYPRTEEHRRINAENAEKATARAAEYWRGRSRSAEQGAAHSARMRGRPAHNRGKPMSSAQKQKSTTHGHSVGKSSPTYVSWAAMIRRCTNPDVGNYRYYGGRGIQVCLFWLDFQNFLADLGERPEGKQLSRIDNNGNYEPGNVIWQTAAENIAERNRRVARRA